MLITRIEIQATTLQRIYESRARKQIAHATRDSSVVIHDSSVVAPPPQRAKRALIGGLRRGCGAPTCTRVSLREMGSISFILKALRAERVLLGFLRGLPLRRWGGERLAKRRLESGESFPHRILVVSRRIVARKEERCERLDIHDCDRRDSS